MKNTAMFWVAVTTLILITTGIMATMNLPFNWVFYICVLGQILLVYMVFRVLTDNYVTNRTFRDLYEDHPMKSEIN
ncbi:hypothetical protein QSE00_12285 [Arenibacter sp. M-2]|uniref:hypothetical protein n=1 Tax=Arenibacter sp. M-2 TaxID=3053612 RepID=UPI000D76D063|nr:hypothetical protein [Arenibacter sp. M-2]MDL5512600.1 hypothetical protein [Arenibacter sp. M-2]